MTNFAKLKNRKSVVGIKDSDILSKFSGREKNLFCIDKQGNEYFDAQKDGKGYSDLFHILECICCFFSLCKFLKVYIDHHRRNRLLDSKKKKT
jgi:hypothetical protein